MKSNADGDNLPNQGSALSLICPQSQGQVGKSLMGMLHGGTCFVRFSATVLWETLESPPPSLHLELSLKMPSGRFLSECPATYTP